MIRRCGAISSIIIATLTLCACGAGDAPDDLFEVTGHIARDAGPTGTCHLWIETVQGAPVGEVAQVLEEGEEFSWLLASGIYDLKATCDNGEGQLRLSVPDQNHRSVEIIVD